MRLSCNGCRVLRKGCNQASCTIRPCLQWIKSPEAQANATVFLAKFYGRAGLMNLINAGPDNHRPAIFRSLLYEACGRIVNPIYGSVGLLWSGNWQMCQAAVEAVLKGAPIVQISSEAAAASPTPAHLHKAYDIRHVSKPSAADSSTAPPLVGDLHKVAKPGRTRFKRASSSSTSAQARKKHRKSDKPSKNKQAPRAEDEDELHHQDEPMTAQEHHNEGDLEDQSPRATLSHASSDTHDEEPHSGREALLDTDTEAGSHVSQAEQSTAPAGPAAQRSLLEEVEDEEEEQQLGLELTLGFAPVVAACVPRPAADAGCGLRGWSASEPGVVGFRFL